MVKRRDGGATMPLGPGDIPDLQLHRYCMNCHKRHSLDEGREFELKRIRPAAIELGRAGRDFRSPAVYLPCM